MAQRRAADPLGSAVPHQRRTGTPPAWLPLLVGAGYVLAGLVSNTSVGLTTGVAVVWLPNAVLVTALCSTPRRWWPWLGLATVAGEMLNDLVLIGGLTPPMSLWLGIINFIECALVGATFLWLSSSRPLLHTPRSVVAFTAAAGLIPALTAIPAAAVYAVGIGGDYLSYYEQWWFGDSLGMVAGVPIGLDIIARARREYAPLNPRMTAIGIGVALTLFIGCGFLAAGINPDVAERAAVSTSILLALWLGVTGAAIGGPSVALVTVIGVAEAGDLSLAASQILTIPLVMALLMIGAVVESLHGASRALKAANQQIEVLAVTDELTGLANLRGLRLIAEAEMTRAVRERVPVAVLYSDLNGLKQINDTLGHAVGSEALIEFANVMRVTMPDAAALARVGGDEFAALFRVRRIEELDEYPAALRAGLDRFNAVEREYQLATSIGVALARPHERLDDFLARADTRMYASKRDRGQDRDPTALEAPGDPHARLREDLPDVSLPGGDLQDA